MKNISKAPDEINCNVIRGGLGIADKIYLRSNIYLGFDCVAQEEDHHAGINLILGAPLPPARYGHSEVAPDVETGHKDEDQEEFRRQNALRQVKIHPRRVIIGP